MRVYLDTSAVLKRVIDEAESAALGDVLDHYDDDGAALVTSQLAVVEVGRALQRIASVSGTASATSINEAQSEAFTGVVEHEVSGQVIALARRVRPPGLRSLDAIHLVTAMLVDADVVVTYDDRLAEACTQNGLTIERPS